MDGQMDKLKGRIKQAAGDLTNNKRLKAVGKAQEFRGNVKNQIDEVADKLKKTRKLERRFIIILWAITVGQANLPCKETLAGGTPA